VSSSFANRDDESVNWELGFQQGVCENYGYHKHVTASILADRQTDLKSPSLYVLLCDASGVE